MKNLDFHIDSAPIHDASIEAKMDFSKVLNQVNAQAGTSGLTAIWSVSISLVLALAFGLGSFVDDTQQSDNGTHNTSVTLLAESKPIAPIIINEEGTNVEITPSENTIENEIPVVIEQVDDKKYEMRVELSEHVNESDMELQAKPQSATKTKLSPVPLKKAKLIPIKRDAINTSMDLRINQGLNINVDLTTYASLKNKANYYFELDTTLTKDLDIALDDNWEEADLKHHPRKDRYNMILRNGNEKRQIVVRLVVTDLKLKSDSKFHLFARLKDIF